MRHTIWWGRRASHKQSKWKAVSVQKIHIQNCHFLNFGLSKSESTLLFILLFSLLYIPGQSSRSVRGPRYAPGIVWSRGRSVGSVPQSGSCYMVTVIFVVCLRIVFTELQRINNCHKKTVTHCPPGTVCRLVWGVYSLCVHFFFFCAKMCKLSQTFLSECTSFHKYFTWVCEQISWCVAWEEVVDFISPL